MPYNTTGNRLALPTYKQYVRDSVESNKFGREQKKRDLELMQSQIKRMRQELKEKQTEYYQKQKRKPSRKSRWEDYTTNIATLRAETAAGKFNFSEHKINEVVENDDSKKVVKKLSLLW